MTTHAGPSLQNYATPDYLVRALERELGRPFDLDVCAEEWNAKAPRFITEAENGLTAQWGRRNWCNPPYSDQAAWMRRASAEAEVRGATTACLVRASIDTSYWLRLVTLRGTCDFLRGRVAFISPVTLKPERGSTFASAIVWYGPAFSPCCVRWRSAATGELIDLNRALQVRQDGEAA